MYERLDNCPLCESGHFRNYMICQDYTVTNESFAIVACDQCGLKFTNPRPDSSEISKFYDSEEYVSHSNRSQNSLMSMAYKTVRRTSIRSKYKFINALETDRKILDYGCGTGHFLAYFADQKWDAFGIEPNEKARAEASRMIGNNRVFASIEEIDPKDKFDIITLWHVLEHIHLLNETIDSLKKLLRKKGYLIIAVPNSDSLDAQHYKEYWAGYDVPRHLYHFTPSTISVLFKKHKLKLVKTLPLVYDSYYVSLLSEKNMTGKNNLLSAIKNGYRSNQEAKKTNDYSSVIYIVEK